MKRAPFKALLKDTGLSQPLLDHLQAEPWRYGFLALMRRIGANPAIDPVGTARLPQAEPFRLGQQPALVFAPREIARAGVAHDRLKIRLFGLGMLGPNGPLPIHVTEIAREREEHRRDPTLSNFLDIFHHRYLTQFYRAWASAQAAAGLDRPDNERFTFYIASLAGHEVREIREGPLPAHARLSAAPHLIRESRNPGGLAATLSHYFNVPVHIDEYVFHWLDVDPDGQSRLGVPGTGSIMAVNAILGGKIPDRQCRFRVVIGPVDIDDYQRFTPRGADLLRLVEWVLVYAMLMLAAHVTVAGEAIFFNQGNLIAYRENNVIEGFYDSENEKFSCYFLFSQYTGGKSKLPDVGDYSAVKVLTFVPGDVSLDFYNRFKDFDIDGIVYRSGSDWIVKTTRSQAGCANAMGVFEFDPAQEGAESYYVSNSVPAIGIRLVDSKTVLFDLRNGKLIARKGYLTKGDGVVVLKIYGQFSYVRYYNPHMNAKNAAQVVTGWVHSANLVNPFPPANKP